MKLHQFGLWFQILGGFQRGQWTTSIPQHQSYQIHYDGNCLGTKFPNVLNIYNDEIDEFVIKLKNASAQCHPVIAGMNAYQIDTLSLNDFEIIPNPNYKDSP